MAKTSKTKRPTVVSFLLDESGSMQAIKSETIDGFNNYIGTLQKDAGQSYRFNFLKFDSTGIRTVYKGEPIAGVKPLTADTYQPGQATPLIDACMKTIKATEESLAKHDDDPAVLVVFQTDGQENSSNEYSHADLAKTIADKQKAGWTFLFLGAGIDAYSQAGQWGISRNHTVSYGLQNSAQVFRAAAGNTMAYAASGGGGSAAAFTAAQKQSAGDAYDNQQQAPDLTGDLMGVGGISAVGAVMPKRAPVIDDVTL